MNGTPIMTYPFVWDVQISTVGGVIELKGPSESAELRPGWVILYHNGQPVEWIPSDQVRTITKGDR